MSMRLIPVVLWFAGVFGLIVATIVVLSLISIYKQTPTSVCQVSFASMVSIVTGAAPMAVKLADLNNDSFLDLVVANFNANTTSVLLGNGNGSFGSPVDLENGPGAGTNGIAIGDVNNDQYLDIVVVNRKASNIGVFLGQGNGSFSQQITYSTGNNSTPAGLALGDLNHDHILDLVVTNHEHDTLFVFLGTNNGTFTMTLTIPTGNYSGPYLVVLNDFNRDNHLDIVVGNGDANYLGIFFGDGTGNFSSQTIYYIASGPYAMVAADFNQDGVLDIVTANYNTNNTSVLLGKGDGTFTQRYTFSTGIGSLPYAVVNGDFNRDNIQDLIFPNSGTDSVVILLGYGNGIFRNQMAYSTGNGSSPVDVTVGDLNGDQRLDFISANNNQDTVSIFLNTCS